MFFKTALLPAFVILLSASTVILLADDNKDKEKATTQKLPGSTLTLEEATNMASNIVLAKVENIAVEDPIAPGQALYSMSLSTTTQFKGKIREEKIDAYLTIKSKNKESEPKAGDSYLAFIQSRPRAIYTIIKLAEKTDENIEAVNKLVRHADSKSSDKNVEK